MQHVFFTLRQRRSVTLLHLVAAVLSGAQLCTFKAFESRVTGPYFCYRHRAIDCAPPRHYLRLAQKLARISS